MLLHFVERLLAGIMSKPTIMIPTFSKKLLTAQSDSDSIVCVGLDPDPDRLPHHLRDLGTVDAVVRYCKEIIDATVDVCCAYKPNFGFFEVLGRNGAGALEDVIRHVPSRRVIIADGKRGDIGNTADRYAKSVFEQLNCDACTVSPYMGSDAVTPFLKYQGKSAFVLVRTSNAGAAELQLAQVEGTPLFMRVAEWAYQWGMDEEAEIGFVVGATDISSMAALRDRYPDVPFLIPGVGAQGGDPREVIAASKPGTSPVVVNSSRSILYAGSGLDYASRAKDAATRLRDELKW